MHTEYSLDGTGLSDDDEYDRCVGGGVIHLDRDGGGGDAKQNETGTLMEPVAIFDRTPLRLQDTADAMVAACAIAQPARENKWDPEKCYNDEEMDDENRFSSETTGQYGPFCFACRVSVLDAQGNPNKFQAEVEEIIQANYKSTVPGICVNILYAYYENKIRHRLPGRPVWNRVTILEHIERHNPSRSVIDQVNFRTITTLCNTLEDGGLCVRDKVTNEVRIDDKHVRMYLVLAKERTRILNASAGQGNGRRGARIRT